MIFFDKVLKTMYMIHLSWQIKHVAAKPILEIQLIHATVRCKVIAFAVQIAVVDVMSAKKLYQDWNKLQFFLFLLYTNSVIKIIRHHHLHIPMIWLVLFEMCQPVFHLIYHRSFYALVQQSYHQVWIQLRRSGFLDIHTYLMNRALSSIFAYLKHLTNFDQY